MSKWYKLDNAAKIFPPNTSKYDTKVFRFAVALKEDIAKDKLQKALNKSLIEYPIFNSVLKSGIFWYYLEETKQKAIVEEEHTRPCEYLNDGLLFRVMFYKNKISLEVSHALTDGTGTLAFLSSIVANYLQIVHNIKSGELMDDASEKEKASDSFSKYKNKNSKELLHSERCAYQIKEEKYPENNLKIIEGKANVKGILKESKSYGVSLTVYLTSILIRSIGKTMSIKERKKPIVITIPVNLRNYFPSHTVRNFFNTININYYYDDQELEDIIKEVDKQLKTNLDKDNINKKMNSMAKLEDIFIIRLIPNFIKNFVLKMAFKIADRYSTMTLSNIGIIKMPEEYQKYIDYFDVFNDTSRIQLCLCSYLDNLVFSFSSKFIDSEIEMNFFRELSNKNINIDIYSNRIEDDNNE